MKVDKEEKLSKLAAALKRNIKKRKNFQKKCRRKNDTKR